MRRPIPVFVVLTLVTVAAPATAGLEGEMFYDLASLETLEASGTVNLTDELAGQFRAKADHDDSGDIGYAEVIGSERAVEDRLEEQTDGFAMDGGSYEIENADADIEGLRGDANTSKPFTVEIGVEATVEPGSGPEHAFAIQRPLSGLAENASLATQVGAPEGYTIVDATSVTILDECTARGANVSSATVTLSPSEDACEDPIPGPSAGLALVGVGLAAAGIRRRGRRER